MLLEGDIQIQQNIKWWKNNMVKIGFSLGNSIMTSCVPN